MTCPYCSRRMQKGIIVFDGRRKPSWFSSEDETIVALTKFKVFSLLSVYKLEAFYCGSCKKVIIDTENVN